MFVNEHLIFIQFEKTGCTHVKRLLQHFLGGTQHDKHSRLPLDFPRNGRPIVGSIRDPWDWYVSMWCYGCIKAGALYDDLMAPARFLGQGWRKAPLIATRNFIKDVKRVTRGWQKTYADSANPALFRRWLAMIHQPANRDDLMDRYAESPISRYAGFYTYRYARMFSRDLDRLYSPELSEPANLKSLLTDNIELDYIIRNERLEEDLIAVLRACGLEPSKADLEFIHSTYKTNPTERVRQTAYYYDDEALELVHTRDRILIEKYGYTPPTLD